MSSVLEIYTRLLGTILVTLNMECSIGEHVDRIVAASFRTGEMAYQ
jgi:hypothetical protein